MNNERTASREAVLSSFSLIGYFFNALSLHYPLGVLAILVCSRLAILAVPYEEQDGIGDIEDIRCSLNDIEHLDGGLDGCFRLVGIEATGLEGLTLILPRNDSLHKGIGASTRGN